MINIYLYIQNFSCFINPIIHGFLSEYKGVADDK